MAEDDQQETGMPQNEEELQRRLEEEVRKLRVEEVLLQSVASLINLTARRIAKEDERDLGQARVGIEAVRALVGLLPEQPQAQIRNALSELQMLYVRAAEGGGEAPAEPAPEPAAGPQGDKPRSRLWTPPGV